MVSWQEEKNMQKTPQKGFMANLFSPHQNNIKIQHFRTFQSIYSKISNPQIGSIDTKIFQLKKIP